MAVNVKVENKYGFEKMLKDFRRAVVERNILHDYKEHEYYEKPSDRKRRKKIQQKREREKNKDGD